jgi:hypothetical protein
LRLSSCPSAATKARWPYAKWPKASRLTTEEEDYEYFLTISSCFVLGCQYFVVRIYCDGQYFYWAVRLVFRNKRGNK